MLQLVESDCRQVYLYVVNPLLAKRLAGMMEHGDFTSSVTKIKRFRNVTAAPSCLLVGYELGIFFLILPQ